MDLLTAYWGHLTHIYVSEISQMNPYYGYRSLANKWARVSIIRDKPTAHLAGLPEQWGRTGGSGSLTPGLHPLPPPSFSSLPSPLFSLFFWGTHAPAHFLSKAHLPPTPNLGPPTPLSSPTEHKFKTCSWEFFCDQITTLAHLYKGSTAQNSPPIPHGNFSQRTYIRHTYLTWEV